MGQPNKIWSYVSRHKYLITIIFGVLLVGVVDENSFRKYIALQMRLSEDREELREYEETFRRDSVRLSEFEANLKGVERIARERYFMKRENEDVFVLSSDKEREQEKELEMQDATAK